MEDSVQLNDRHYEIALPWRTKTSACLPDSRPLTQHRLNTLKKRFTKDEELFQCYLKFIENLVKMGYAERIPEEEREQTDGHVWHLPHHPVFHPVKKKIRVVFDCSAKYREISLNNQLLTGPNLTNTLVGVLLRFRQEPVAIRSDIEAMFHQVCVIPEHRDFL